MPSILPQACVNSARLHNITRIIHAFHARLLIRTVSTAPPIKFAPFVLQTMCLMQPQAYVNFAKKAIINLATNV